MNESQHNAFLNRQSEEFLTIQEFAQICLNHLSWFCFSLGFTLTFAIYYLNSSPDMYTREAAVLLKSETMGAVVAQKTNSTDFNNMALVQQPVSVPNVLRQYTSLALLNDVAKRLGAGEDSVSMIRAAEGIRSRLTVTQDNEQGTIINLKYVDYTPERAEQVLNAVIDVYNEHWLREKNMVARNSALFIKGRLKDVENDLGRVDDSISTYKMHHQITDVEQVSNLYLQRQTDSETDMLKIDNQLSQARYLMSLLNDKNAHDNLLPTNTGLENAEVNEQIAQYNRLLLRLKNNLVGTSSQNPIILRQEAELTDIRNNIISSIGNQVKALQMQLQLITSYNEEAKARVASSPEQSKRLMAVERDQKVKESLYLYLLQKKEENEMSMTYTPVPTQVIDMPHGSNAPSFPNKKSILMAALLSGLVIPMVILFIRVSLDNTVRTKVDIENRTAIPVIGEIPHFNTPKRRFWQRRITLKDLKKGVSTPSPILVEHAKQDLLNEAFRFIRSNLEFMTDNSEHKNLFIITSMYPGSGKTFTSTNLAVALAIKGRSVLLIDGDMRRASTSKIFGNRPLGLADYLAEKAEDMDDISFRHPDYPTLTIMPVGTTPPNPTELLSGPRLEKLLQKVRPLYEYVLIDCPMTENLADATIIGHLADRTLYVMRAGIFQRKLVTTLDTNVRHGKYKNVSIILNGIQNFNHKYGYYYGYYGYYGHSHK